MARAVELGALSPICATQGWGRLQFDRSVQGGPLKIGNRTFDRGLGTHSWSEIAYDLNGQYIRFTAWVGVDAEMKDYKDASVVFKVCADGRELWSSGVMKIDTPAKRVSVPLAGACELRLVVEDAGDGNACDHADWADPMLFGTPKSLPIPKAKYSIRVPGLTLTLSERGEVTKAIMGRTERVFPGRLRLLGCKEGSTSALSLPNGGIEFARTMTNPDGECRVAERFIPTANSIRWEVEIAGSGEPWSTPIVSQFRWPDAKNSLFWTAWDEPEPDGSDWQDPLVARPFANRSFLVGSLSLPIATAVTPADDTALSLVWSPEDVYLYASLGTGRDGTITFARADHRICGARPIRFSADFVPHKADWRAALGWMVKRYPSYFNPPNPAADDMAGCGAYSSHEGDLDVERFKKMTFRVNWKASFDFPYIGMFLPPVKSDDEKWFRFDSDSGGNPNGRQTETCIDQMAAYSSRMRDMGFHVLSYFNVTEMGTAATSPPQPDRPWSDPGKYVYSTFGDAIAANDAGHPTWSWGASLLMDCAVPSYQVFLLEQAKRHIDKFPASAGICIDRMDWLSHYNSKADDGVTWRMEKPMRALSESWKLTMSKLGPLMHSNGKVIFVNPLSSMRLDLMRQVDGVYHEFGDQGSCLNGTAFLCLRKPAIAWIHHAGVLGDDPDAYFQRHLHLGVFPTAPLPGNDHAINPSEADRWFLDYGPLLDLMRGKKWVLEPHVIEADGNARVNLFEVPGGYVVPVTFGGDTEKVGITVRKPSALRAWPGNLTVEVFHPGSDQPVKVSTTVEGGILHLTVPLSRGCAMVRIEGRHP
jgi:hypothetical protein